MKTIDIQSHELATWPSPAYGSEVLLRVVNVSGKPLYRHNGANWVAVAMFDENGLSIQNPQKSKVPAIQLLMRTGIPIGLPGPGNVSTNGSFTLTSPLQTAFPGGIYLYFLAGALYAGSVAGFYYTIMGTASSGTAYDNRIDGSGVPVIPSNPTPIVSGAMGAFSGTTNEITVLTFVIPGGLLGANGQVKHSYLTSMATNANNKVMRIKWNGITLEEETVANGTGKSFSGVTHSINRGRADRQVNMTTNGYNVSYAVTPSNPGSGNIDTGADVTGTVTLITQTATDFNIIEAFVVEAIPT